MSNNNKHNNTEIKANVEDVKEEVKEVKTEKPVTPVAPAKPEPVKEVVTEKEEKPVDKKIEDGFKTRTVLIRANTRYSAIISKNLPYEGDVAEILIKASLKAGHIVIEKRGEDQYVLSLSNNNEIVETKVGKEEVKEETK